MCAVLLQGGRSEREPRSHVLDVVTAGEGGVDREHVTALTVRGHDDERHAALAEGACADRQGHWHVAFARYCPQ